MYGIAIKSNSLRDVQLEFSYFEPHHLCSIWRLWKRVCRNSETVKIAFTFELADQRLHNAPQLVKMVLKFPQSEAQRFDFITLFLKSLMKSSLRYKLNRKCGKNRMKIFVKCIKGEHCVDEEMHAC